MEHLPPTAPGDCMLPSSDRLLRGIQATLQNIATIVADEQSKAELSIIDCVLSELARRNQIGFYLAFYEAERSFLAEGLALFRASIAPDQVATIEKALAASLPPALDGHWGFEAIAGKTRQVMDHLATLVRSTQKDAVSAAARSFMQRIVAKENEFHLHRAQLEKARQKLAGTAPPPLTAERLQDYLCRREPDRRGLRVTNFRQLVGGFQKVTILFDIEDDSGRKESLVLRSEKDDKFVALDASDIRREYEIIRFVYEAGVAVAEPLWLEQDESKLGHRFLVSRKVAGENFGTAVSSTGISDEIARSYVEAIAKLHKIPVSDTMRRLPIGHWLDHTAQEDNTRACVLFWRNQPWSKSSNPSPLTEYITAWLLENVPRGEIPQCLIHCDYGPHNTLVHNGRLSGILDWESARIGDPAEDISWFLQSCGGQVDYGKAIAWYEECTGHRISEYRLRYYDVLGCLKVMVSSGWAEAMYEADEAASIVWLNIPFRFTSYATTTVEDRIKRAESADGR